MRALLGVRVRYSPPLIQFSYCVPIQSEKVIIDSEGMNRTTCRHCGRPLPPSRSAFCSMECVDYYYGRWLNGKPDFGAFARRVRHAVPLAILAERLHCDVPEVERRARSLATTKRILLWEVEDSVTHIGIPMSEAEREVERRAAEKRARSAKRRARLREQEEQRREAMRACAECGMPFASLNGQSFCSPACRGVHTHRITRSLAESRSAT